MKPSELNIQILNSHLAAAYLRDRLMSLDHEELWGIFLRKDKTVIVCEMLTKGTLTSTPIDARTIVKRALLVNAFAVVLLHNHPSGNSLPSQSDIMATSRIKSACSIFDVYLLDHIILSENSFYSFSEERVLSY